MLRSEVQVMLTVVMRQRFSDMPAQDASALLSNAPGLLAGFEAAIGCLPEGEATLHRRVTLPAGDAEGQALAGEMVATARLATVGEMASLLSHELNQPLAAIASYASGSINLLESAEAAPGVHGPASFLPDVRVGLQRIAQQAERAGR